MEYTTPELKKLGSLTGLTLGMNGSSPDGMGLNQLGFGNDDNPIPPLGDAMS